MTEQTPGVAQPRKRGMIDVVFVIVAAALIMSPSYVGAILNERLGLDIRAVVIVALALFAVGIYLLIRVVRD